MEFKQFHSTSVVLDDSGIMIIGEPGIGKSDLALRLIDSGATLIADDITICRKIGEFIFLFSREETRGLLEVRDLGIINVPYVENIKLVMIVNLLKINKQRIPTNNLKTIMGKKFPRLSIVGSHASSIVKVKFKLNEINEFK